MQAATTKDVPKAPKRLRPTRALPTERMAFTKQKDLLRAFGTASLQTERPVTNKQASALVNMSEATTSLANAFFIETGLLQRGDGGFVPNEDVRAFAHVYEWEHESASFKLAPTIRGSWFAKVLMPRVSFEPLEESDAITLLATACSAPPDYKTQIRLLIDFIEAAGLIERDGTKLRAVRKSQAVPAETVSLQDDVKIEVDRTPVRAPAVTATAFTNGADGAVQFTVAVKVDMKEFASWSPDRLTAFFSGIAKVLAAKSGLEKMDELKD